MPIPSSPRPINRAPRPHFSLAPLPSPSHTPFPPLNCCKRTPEEQDRRGVEAVAAMKKRSSPSSHPPWPQDNPSEARRRQESNGAIHASSGGLHHRRRPPELLCPREEEEKKKMTAGPRPPATKPRNRPLKWKRTRTDALSFGESIEEGVCHRRHRPGAVGPAQWRRGAAPDSAQSAQVTGFILLRRKNTQGPIFK